MFWEISKALDRRLTFFIFVYFLWVVSRRPEKIGVMKLTSISCDYLWNLAFHDMNGGQSFTSQRRRHLYNSCVLSSSRESVAARICWIRDEPESPLFADCPVLFTLLTLSLFWSSGEKQNENLQTHHGCRFQKCLLTRFTRFHWTFFVEYFIFCKYYSCWVDIIQAVSGAR